MFPLVIHMSVLKVNKRKQLVFLAVLFAVVVSTFIILLLQMQAVADPTMPFLTDYWLKAPIWLLAWAMTTVVLTMLFIIVLPKFKLVK